MERMGKVPLQYVHNVRGVECAERSAQDADSDEEAMRRGMHADLPGSPQ